MTVELLYKDLTHVIVGAAMEVHRILGSGFLESVYENSLKHELRFTYEQRNQLGRAWTRARNRPG